MQGITLALKWFYHYLNNFNGSVDKTRRIDSVDSSFFFAKVEHTSKSMITINMERIVFVLFVLIQLIVVDVSATEVPSFKVNTTSSGEDTKSIILMKTIIAKLYERANYKVNFLHTTRKRESVLLQQGKIDAVFARYRNIGDADHRLIRLEPELIKAYALIICPNSISCQSYRHTKIGYLHQFQYAKTFCTDQKLNCREFKTEVSLYKAMAEGYIDVMISYEVNLEMLKKVKFDSQIYAKKLKELSFNSYHYLHIKNKNHLKQLSQALTTLHQEGFIEKLFSRFQYESLSHKNITILP